MPNNNKSGRPRRNAVMLRAQMERLDELMRAIYECSFNEFLDIAFRHAYHCGHEVGKREGRIAGRRSAKGLKGNPKEPGRPLEVEQNVRNLMASYIDQQKIHGKTIKKSINEFLETMRLGQEELNVWDFLRSARRCQTQKKPSRPTIATARECVTISTSKFRGYFFEVKLRLISAAIRTRLDPTGHEGWPNAQNRNHIYITRCSNRSRSGVEYCLSTTCILSWLRCPSPGYQSLEIIRVDCCG